MDNDLRRVADQIARRIRQDIGTDGPHVFDVAGYYFQYLTDPEQPGIHLELVGNEWLPEELHLSPADEQVLRDLGFADPDEDWSNWYVETLDDSESDAVAWAVVDALMTAYRVPIEDIAEAVGLPRVQYEGDPKAPFNVETDDSGAVAHPEQLGRLFEAYLAARREPRRYRSPWERGTRAAFFAEVDRVDRTAVMDLFALVAAGPGDTRATWLRRERLGWVVDPLLPVKLTRGTARPLVPLSRQMAAELEPQMQFRDGPAVMERDGEAKASA